MALHTNGTNDHQSSETSRLLPDTSKSESVDRGGYATLWAACGLVWLITALQAVIRWVFSSDFTPAPVIGPDHFPVWRMAGLRILEVASGGVLLAFIYFCVIAPLWTTTITLDGSTRKYTGKLSLDGKFVIGGLCAWIADGFLNCREYLFAWNSHSVNLGVWTRFLPFHNPHGPTGYAEGLIWGVRIYFSADLSTICLLVPLGFEETF